MPVPPLPAGVDWHSRDVPLHDSGDPPRQLSGSVSPNAKLSRVRTFWWGVSVAAG